MNTDYVYNTIKRILGERVNNRPNNVPFNELSKAVMEDLKLAVNQLVSDKKISFRKDVNGNLLLYAVD